MATHRRLPTRWFGAGALLGLGFLMGLVTSGVLVTQLSGGSGSSALAAEAESPSPTPTPPPRSVPPFGSPTPSPAPTPTPEPTPTPSSETEAADEDDDEDDDAPAPLPGGTAPRSPRLPGSAQDAPQPIIDALGLDGDGSEGPEGETDAATVQPGSVIQGPVYVTIVYKGEIDIDFKQKVGAESGDAVAASQVMAAVTAGNADLEGHNAGGGGAGDIIAGSGSASAQNDIEVTGPFVRGGVDWRDVTINGPVSWSVVFEDDVKLKFKQKGAAATGAALANSQLFGVSADGDANIGASNLAGAGGSGESTARSGDAQVSNAIDVRSPLVVGDFVLQGSTLNGALTQSVAYHEDFKVKFKQDFLTISGISAAATQYIDEIRAGGDVGIALENHGTGASRSGDSGGSNAVDAGSNIGGGPSVVAAAAPDGDRPEASSSIEGSPETPDVRTTSDATPASSTLPTVGWTQLLLLAGGLVIGLGGRRPGRRSRRRRAQTSMGGRP